MSEKTSNAWAVWAPTIIAVIGPIVTLWVGYEVNRVEHGFLKLESAAIRAEMMPMEKRMTVWMPRAETDVKFTNLERQVVELKAMIGALTDKIDRLTRQGGSEILLKE